MGHIQKNKNRIQPTPELPEKQKTLQAQTCHPGTWKWRQEDYKLEVQSKLKDSLGNLVRLSQNKK